MKILYKLLIFLVIIIFIAGCAGVKKLEKTGSETGISDWSNGSQFTATQANTLKASIDDNYSLISSLQSSLSTAQSDISSLQSDLAADVASLTSLINAKQDTVPAGSDAAIDAGTSTADALWSAAQLKLAAQTHGAGWQYIPRASAPTSPTTGMVYNVDITGAWNPVDSVGTSDYYVYYNGSAYLPLWEDGGGPIVLGSAPSSPVAGWYYWAQAGGAWDPDTFVGGSDPYEVYFNGSSYITIMGKDGTLYVNKGAPYDINWAFLNPATDDVFYVKVNRALTISSIGGIVDPGGSGESAVFDVQECDSDAANCSSILSSTVTAANTATAGTISDSTIAAGAFVKIVLGTVTGSPPNLLVYGDARGEY